MGAEGLTASGWRRRVREWPPVAKLERPETAVRFFERAFERFPYPEYAYFGVHGDRISLTVGNIWLAAFWRRDRSYWLLVDKPWRGPRFASVPAESTTPYRPLHWLKFPPDHAAEALRLERVWKSYGTACLEMLRSPVSRITIASNLKNKVTLQKLRGAGAGLPSLATLDSSPYAQKGFLEGAAREITSELRERSRALKRYAVARYGLRCQVCNFSFEEAYGELGKGYIEVHHLTPLSQRRRASTTKSDEVTVVCANCHRVLHRGGARPIPVEELQRVVSRRAPR